jgi:hypothetical protein
VKRFSAFLGFLAACGGASAEGPLDITIGTTRDTLVHQLRGHAYCQNGERDEKDPTEMFPQCSAPGAEYGQTWVIATYDEGGRAVKVERFEKYTETARAEERFNDLVAARSKSLGDPSDGAKQQLQAQESLPDGTRSWVAFSSEGQLVAVYLLDPRPPGYANVLEEVVETN